MCSNFLVVSECFFSIIKLAQDALKELVKTKSCKYDSLVATHLNVYRLGQTSELRGVPRDYEWNKYLRSCWSSLHLLLAGQELH